MLTLLSLLLLLLLDTLLLPERTISAAPLCFSKCFLVLLPLLWGGTRLELLLLRDVVWCFCQPQGLLLLSLLLVPLLMLLSISAATRLRTRERILLTMCCGVSVSKMLLRGSTGQLLLVLCRFCCGFVAAVACGAACAASAAPCAAGASACAAGGLAFALGFAAARKASLADSILHAAAECLVESRASCLGLLLSEVGCAA